MQIKATDITYTYMKETPFEKVALQQLNLEIQSNSFTSIIGHTGSGKSTFVQLLNGLLKPTSGTLHIEGWSITNHTKQKELYQLRKQVGMVFQYPEHQLFHETILQDVAYGPINFGTPKEEAMQRAREVLSIVGIEEELFDRSPFDLSGGQMRRVAIAGVLAIGPRLLILDEPTAGLDPQGQHEMMDLFFRWYKEDPNRSIVLVTHKMEDAASYSDTIHVMANGTLQVTGTPKEVFSKEQTLHKLGLDIPETVQLLRKLKNKSGTSINTLTFNLTDTVGVIKSFLGKD